MLPLFTKAALYTGAVAASYPTRMESRAVWRTCSLLALAAVCIIAGLMGSSYGPDPSTQQPAEPPRYRMDCPPLLHVEL